MQAQAADNLARLLAEALAPLTPQNARTLYGPRRIAWMGNVAPEVPASTINERGPKLAAPEQALTGFMRKHGATRDDLRQDGGYWVLEKTVAGRPASALIAEAVPTLLRRFPWPKSMRWAARAPSPGCALCAASSACSMARLCLSVWRSAMTTAMVSPAATSPRAIASWRQARSASQRRQIMNHA